MKVNYKVSPQARAILARISSRECDVCGEVNERVLTDSWTGYDMCLECVGQVASQVTNSPCTEGDNMDRIIRKVIDEDWEED